MKLIDQLLDYSKAWELPDVYLFTGNPALKNNGAIVMGRGAAKQVRDSYPGIDRALGAKLKEDPVRNLMFVEVLPNDIIPRTQYLGWFKVKYHWSEPADLNLIRESTRQLSVFAEQRDGITFHMNYPGIGNGRLNEQDIQPILETLPDNVWIYR